MARDLPGGTKFVDGVGYMRIIKKVLSFFYKKHLRIRRAAIEDAEDVFNLANDETIRKNSFETDTIEWDQHLEWFRNKLGDNDCLFFIVDFRGHLVGQVRFDKDSIYKEAVISISLDKSLHGLNLSSFIISESTKRMKEAYEGIKSIKAYIKNENIPSIKAFEKAGFRFFGDTMVKGCKSKVYEKVIA